MDQGFGWRFSQVYLHHRRNANLIFDLQPEDKKTIVITEKLAIESSSVSLPELIVTLGRPSWFRYDASFVDRWNVWSSLYEWKNASVMTLLRTTLNLYRRWHCASEFAADFVIFTGTVVCYVINCLFIHIWRLRTRREFGETVFRHNCRSAYDVAPVSLMCF